METGPIYGGSPPDRSATCRFTRRAVMLRGPLPQYLTELYRLKSIRPVSKDVLLVAMRDTPDLSVNPVLPFVSDEVKMLEELSPSLQLKLARPQELKKDVLSQLRTCKVFHFAGHGHSDPLEPSQSCLLLKDWKTDPLTVADLRDYSFQENSPFLGYLSACSTGANDAKRFTDEAIHLVSACQLAGFRHVVGTLWEVSDSHCVSVARLLYETIRDEGMTDRAICRGLHRALRALRDMDIKLSQATDGTGAAGTAGHNIIPEAAKVGDSVVETMQQDGGQSRSVKEDSAQETIKLNRSMSATLGKMEIRPICKKEVEGENSRNEDVGVNDGNSTMALNGDGNDTTLEERNVVLSGHKGYTTRQKTALSWVPYIHFGV